MFVLRHQFTLIPRMVMAAGVILAPGCGLVPPAINDDQPRTTLGLGGVSPSLGVEQEEDGTDEPFQTATLIDLADGPWLIQGEISSGRDIDVFNLGAGLPGDRIRVDVTTADQVDAAVALFDETGVALLINDHRNSYLGRRGPFIDVTLRRPSAACYMAVSSTPGFEGRGDYEFTARHETQQPTLSPRPDTVLLVFDGGRDVRIGTPLPINVPAFDVAGIDRSLAGRTEEIVRLTVAAIRDDYAPYEVTILSTTEGAVFDGSMTRIFFGTFDAALLGVAEGVDEFNASRGQSAIVFTDSFESFMILNPSIEELAQGLANVASHEIGHLLGLVHTADPDEIMDVTASLSQLLVNQTFGRAPIEERVFPLGEQDAVRYLLDSVGGNEFLARQPVAKTTQSILRRAAVGPPCRQRWLLSSCGLHE